jgi:hypothetical protein
MPPKKAQNEPKKKKATVEDKTVSTQTPLIPPFTSETMGPSSLCPRYSSQPAIYVDTLIMTLVRY